MPGSSMGLEPGLLEHMPCPTTASLGNFRWVTSSLIFQDNKTTPVPPESTRDRSIPSPVNLSRSWFIQLENCRNKETGWN